MDGLSEWFTRHKLPVGDWVEHGVDLLNDHAAGLFDLIADNLEILIEGLIDILQWFPPVALAVLLALFGGALHRSWKLGLIMLLALLFILNQGYWEETTETLALVIVATFICMLLGVPLGVATAHRSWLYTVVRPVLDLMQTIPTFAYLIPTLILFGLGVVPGLISTIIFAIPAPIRLTHLGIVSVPRNLIEAGDAFGATRQPLLWKVEIPHALPNIMAGLTQCIMLSLSMVVIAALVGADGLGEPVVRALNTVNIAQGFEAGLAIVLVAILLDRVCRRPGAGD